jgi:hypothetical protein
MVSAASARLTEEAFAAVRATPGFRAACEQASAESVRLFVALDPAYQWISKDLGRGAICMTAAMMH